jgi:hypothetical protein
MRVQQAIVAVGGRGSRLNAEVAVPLTKSFLEVGGRPLLYWCLEALYTSGIRRVIVAAEANLHPRRVDLNVCRDWQNWKSFEIFLDAGLGVHGIPQQARSLLDDYFVFDVGHNVSSGDHLRKICAVKSVDNFVVSGFSVDDRNPRNVVDVSGSSERPVPSISVAHPYVADHGYTRIIEKVDFRIGALLNHYIRRGGLVVIGSDSPPEFDMPYEYRSAMAHYINMIQHGD